MIKNCARIVIFLRPENFIRQKTSSSILICATKYFHTFTFDNNALSYYIGVCKCHTITYLPLLYLFLRKTSPDDKM